MPARRVGADPETDVAVIQVRADGLTELPFGNSDRLEVGDFVFAIGNPQRIGQTVTAGIVSGLHRANVGLGPYEDFIQTDAAIYPGNSGGALVDLRGDLVGINTAFMAVGKNNPGMSFAIPINMARALVDQMLEFGDIRRGVLDFTYDDFTSAPPRDLAGAVVRAVDPRSAAERAGLGPERTHSGEEAVLTIGVSRHERLCVIRRVRKTPGVAFAPPEWLPADALDENYFRLLPYGQSIVTTEEATMLAAVFGEDGELPARPLS